MRKWIIIAALAATPAMLSAKGQSDWLAIEGRAAADIKQDEGRKVVAWNPAGFAGSDPIKAKWADIAVRAPAISYATGPFDSWSAPAKSYDFALFHLVYHDLYWQSDRFNVPKTDPDAVLKRLYVAMKPGGIVGVVDHVGAKGDTRATVDAVHRIDPEVVKADFARAGFKLVGESQHLRTKDDDYAKNVFDPALRGKTDRFVFKFRKPK